MSDATEDIEWLVGKFIDAGLDVRRRRRWSKERYVIYTNAEWARVVWSLLGRDRCFIQHGDEITFGERMDGAPEDDFATWCPARYIHRFVGDWRRRSIVPFIGGLAATLFPLLAFRRLPDIWSLAIALIVGLLLFLAIVQFAFEGEAYDMRTMWLRLIVGVAVGLLWASSGTNMSPMAVAGAVWVFTLSNLIMIATVGHDRFLFESELRSVGGPLSRSDALKMLERRKIRR